QQCGLMIDFDHCSARTLYADKLEDGSLPEVIECDTVATCAVMIRGRAVRETDVGIMPEDNFIYWDDMEWGHRMHLAGYRTVTLGSAAAVHMMGANVKKPTTFLNYYMWRNRTNFFMRYTPEEDLDKMSLRALGDFFHSMYECLFREEHNNMKSISMAYADALAGVRGKATEGKILPNDANDDKLTAFLQDKKSYRILEEDMGEDANYLRNFIASVNPDCREVKEGAEVTFHMSHFIFGVKDFSLKEVYIDGDRNCITCQDDLELVKNYDFSKMLFIYMNQPAFLEACRKLRKNNGRKS
ncbi:MAG: hypothetical protein K6G62_02855, partial [Eubacterium sp.]|nr:hypothetical protein [Eubacterium sp.]